MSGLYTAGGLVGALISSLLADRLGRKRVIFMASIMATIGGALQGGSVDLGMFIFVRFISGLGVGMCFLEPQVHETRRTVLTLNSSRTYLSFNSHVPNGSVPSPFSWDDGRFARRSDHFRLCFR